METDPRLEPIWRLAEPVALEAGLELVDVEYRREGHGTVLRLLMDKPGGVSLDELTAISRQLSDILDVHAAAVAGPYTLEVSSPGVNRPLTRPAHFQSFVGKRVHVQTRVPLGDRRSFRGRLEAVSSSGIVVVGDDGQLHAIPFAMIARAHYQHDFTRAARPRPVRTGRRVGAPQGS